MTFKFITLSAAALLTYGVALAQTTAPSAASSAAKVPEPNYTLAFNVGAVTDYRFRGISQTSIGPAVQGGIDFAHKSGFYLGTWASNVKWVKAFNGASQGGLEWDVYGGFKKEIAKALTVDVGAIAYKYPGNDSGAANTLGAGAWSNVNTNEWYGAITYNIVTLKYNRSTGDFLGNIDSKGSNYIDLSAGYDLGDGMLLTPHIGRQVVAGTTNTRPLGLANYTDYALTLAKDFGNGFVLSAAVTGTSASKQNGAGFYNDYPQLDGKFIAGTAVVLGAKYNF